jgi:hypothetical protein
MTSPHDVIALRRKRDAAAVKADQMATLFDQFPRGEIKVERDRLARLVNSYDRLLGELCT